MNKTCIKCGEELPLERFHRHPKGAHGRIGTCKGCRSAYMKARYSPSGKVVKRSPQRISSEKAYKQKNRDKAVAWNRKHNQRNPEKRKARNAVTKAMARGKIARKPCQVCGEPESEAHHPNYERPLDVVFLCHRHHRRVHRKIRELSS